MAHRRARRESYSSGGFASAEHTRDSVSWLTSRLSPESALEEARSEQLQRADAAYKNHELGANHVEGRAIRVSGTGTSLDPAIDPEEGDFSEEQAEAWNRTLRRLWVRQSQRIGKGNKPQWRVQQLLTRHLERHGEWFLLIGDRYDPLSPTTLKIEVIHPNRVESPPEKAGDPTVRMGVQLNGDGEAVGYYVRDSHPGDTRDSRVSYRYVPSYYANGLPRLLHYFEETEAGVHRGYPRMQVSFKRMKDSDEYSAAELDRNYNASCNVGVIHTDADEDDVLDDISPGGLVTNYRGERLRTMQPGEYQYAGVADRVTFNNPQGAPATFGEFQMFQATMIAAGAGTSYPFISNDFRGLNYNTLKVVWNAEEAACDVAHQAQADALVWVYWHFVNRCILVANAIDVEVSAYRSEPWVYSAVRVIPPARRSIDPAREDNAEIRLIENGIKPASDLVERKNGQPAPAVYKRIKRDKAQREAEGVAPVERAPSGQTMPGDLNDESSEANSERQEAISQPLRYYRTTPTKAAEKLPVDRKGGKFGAGVIRNASLLTVGEALGHYEWVDAEFTESVAAYVNGLNKGAKVRFTHPSLSGDGLGRFMGRAFDAQYIAETGQAVADIHLAKSSHETPDGDLGKYVMDLAEEDPEAFAISIAFERDRKAERVFAEEHTEEDEFASPDEANANNYPHVRLKALIAADFVDEPAANPGGLFHRGHEIAAEADKLCAYALGLSDEKPDTDCFSADADRVQAFAQRFLNSRELTIMSKNPETTPEQKQGETVTKEQYDALAAKLDDVVNKYEALSDKYSKAVDEKVEAAADEQEAEAKFSAEQKRVADLYKLATSAGLDDANGVAEKWAEQGLSVVEAKAALADKMLAANGLTDDGGQPEEDPHAGLKAAYRANPYYKAEGISEEDFVAMQLELDENGGL
ncbi:gene 4 [Symbiodinium pilosum]|uniref:Gene 4 protein n=1 Tax=Symbiodinium pilosum TaxID=2952 RepID=A0A812S2M1_SYMPI|nr:gene 4 [Symbiodinium pilosum]